jgi:4-hydroxybenzoyl-CoA thioesterase
VSRPITVRVHVRWSDCDPAGIAFYPRFFEWMDVASHAIAREMGITAEDMLTPRLLGFPVVAVRGQFLSPAHFEDALEVRTWVTRIGRTSVGLRHEVVCLGDEETVLAHGWEDRVHISRDAAGALLPRELTPSMRAALERHLDPDPTFDRPDR